MRLDDDEQQDWELLCLRSDLAAIRLKWSMLRLSYLLGKANFNPNQPRVPRGDPHGGRWTREGTGSELKPSNTEPSGPPIRVGDPEDPLDIPRDRPPTERERNAVAKRTAAWLLRNGFRLGLGLSPVGRVIDAVELGLWLYEKAPLIDAYLDPPKTLEQLQNGINNPKPGYQRHHIVEEDAARKAGFDEQRIQARDNTVLVPTFRHWRITAWYMIRNERYGGMSPRMYLRDKGWNERRRVGLEALIEAGVLGP